MNIPLQTQSFEPKQALTGKVSLITGSTSGIGLGIARALASAGSDIVLNGFGKPEQVAELQQEIAADYRVRVTYSAADMSKPDASAFHTTRLALPAMLANKWGRIINIASAHGLVASPYKSAYVAAKHGIVGLTKVIALETAEQGITCNAI